MSPRRFAKSCVVLSWLLWPCLARAQGYDDYFHGFEAAPRPPPPVPEPPPAPPVDPPAAPFGSRGEWVVGGSSSAGVGWQKFGASDAVYVSAALAPTVDTFVVRNVSLGLATGVSWSDQKGYGADGSLVETRTTSLRAGPRVGVNLPLGRTVSLWTLGTLGLEWVQRDESLVSGGTLSVAASPLGYPASTEFGPWVSVDAMLLFHVRPHLFVGADASAFHDFGHVQGGPDVGGEQTQLSLGFVLGGWFGGPRAVEPDAAPPASGRVRRFGESGQVVVSNELTLGGRWSGYSGSTSSSASASVTAGVDYFLGDYFSLGAFASGSYSTIRALDPTTSAQVQTSSTGGSFGLRVGANIPMGAYLSLWPRASLSTGEQLVDEVETKENREDQKIVSVALFAPLLVHPATHFFVGFGPTVATDLSRAIVLGATSGGVQYTVQNPSTSAGASTVVGGWF